MYKNRSIANLLSQQDGSLSLTSTEYVDALANLLNKIFDGNEIVAHYIRLSDILSDKLSSL